MAENESTGEQKQRGDLKSALTTRFLTPLAAAAASAAAGWIVKKGPDFVEQTLLPRLRSASGNGGGVASDLPSKAGSLTRDLPSKAGSVASTATDMVQELGEKAKSLVTSETPSPSNGNRRRRSLDELEKRRDERARARAERKSKAR